MNAERSEPVWLTAEREFSMPELAELSGLTVADLRELVDYGTITPINPEASPWVFRGECLLTVRMACRVRTGFDLDPHGVALTVSLLERISELEDQLRTLRAHLPRKLP